MEGSGPQAPTGSTPVNEPKVVTSGAPVMTAAPPLAPAAADGATPPVVTIKPARQFKQKTPAQKEALEAAFLANQYPNEQTRRALADSVGLTDNQVSTWFSHRRRRERDRKAADEAGPSGAAASALPSAAASGLTGLPEERERGGGDSEGTDNVDIAALAPADAQKLAEYEALLLAARSTLDEPYREDGPPLGLEFDDIPSTGRKRGTGEDLEGAHDAKRARAEGDGAARAEVARLDAAIRREQERLERKRDRMEAKVIKERERELARLEAERRRQLDRALKEEKREAGRKAKEAARAAAAREKEEKRQAAARERELKAQEKRKEQEAKRREREVQKALTQQEKAAMRLRDRAPAWGPKDDLDVEWEGLIADYKRRTGLPPDTPTPAEGGTPPPGLPPLPERPPFPPPAVNLRPAVSAAPGGDAPGSNVAGDLLAVWSELTAFSPMLGLSECPSVDELLSALVEGASSSLLSEIHVALLRLLLADAEEAHAAAGDHLAAAGGAANEAAGAHAHAHLTAGARLLEEAWAWGFDVDAWRAHAGPLTWPEVARQVAVAAGLGRRRPQRRKRGDMARMGKEGEDVVPGSGGTDGTGPLRLELPPRLGTSSIKGAAWLVLRDAGPEGLHVEEIARRIQARNLRDLRTTKNPETSIAGALARDLLFERVSPATFALRSVRLHHLKATGQAPHTEEGDAAEGGVKAEEGHDGDVGPVKMEVDTGAGAVKKEEGDSPGGGGGGGAKSAKASGAGEEDEDSDGEEHEREAAEEEERHRRDEAHEGEAWVAALRDGDYNSLTLDERLAALGALCQLVLESPCVRDVLELRLEEQQRVKRVAFEEGKAEAAALRARRQAEQAARTKVAMADVRLGEEIAKAAAGGTPATHDGAAALAAVAANAHVDAARAAVESAQAEVAAAAAASAEFEAVVKGRAHERAEAAVRDVEACAVRAEPLGMDRRYNKYWLLAGAPGGRVFVESEEDGTLRMLCTPEALEALLAALDRRGPREKALHAAMLRHKASLVAGMPGAPLALPSAPPVLPSPAALQAGYPLVVASRAEDNLSRPFVPGEAPEMTVLKADLLAMEYSLPEDAFNPEFDPDEWRAAVRAAPDAAALRRCLGHLETGLTAAALHPDFERQPLLVKGAWIPVGTEVATAAPGATAGDMALLPPSPLPPRGAGHHHAHFSGLGAAEGGSEGGNAADDAMDDAEPEPLGWLPPTIAAVALRLASLDSALVYGGGTAARESAVGYRRVLRPALLRDARDGIVVGPWLSRGGRVAPTLFPPFPYRLLFGPRQDFAFDVEKFKEHVEKGVDDAVVVSTAAHGRGLTSVLLGRGGTKGRPKGSKNKPRAIAAWAPRGGRGSAARGGRRGGRGGRGGGRHASTPSGDSDRHYGSGFDDEEEDNEEDYVISAPKPSAAAVSKKKKAQKKAPAARPAARSSVEPSTAPPSAYYISDDDEEEEDEPEDAGGDEYRPEEDEEARESGSDGSSDSSGEEAESEADSESEEEAADDSDYEESE